jgi:hypothetical protein
MTARAKVVAAVVGALLLIGAAYGIGVLLRGSTTTPGRAAAGAPGSSPASSSTDVPATPTTAPSQGVSAGPTNADSGQQTTSAMPSSSAASAMTPALTVQIGPYENTPCAAHAFGAVALYLRKHGCTGLWREIATASVNGRPVTVSIVKLSLDSGTDANSFARIATTNGTGDVYTLISEGYSYAGAPPRWSDDPSFLDYTTHGNGVVILEAMWADQQPTHEFDPALMRLLHRMKNLSA